MEIAYFGICDIGLKRKVNQDSLLTADRREEEMYLFVVADGMGGHSDGELASKALTEGMRTWADAFSVKKYDGNFRNMMLSLQNRIEEINRKIYIEYNQSQICGSTCVVLLLFRNIYGVISAGDSRLYLHRGFKTTSVTTDDVWENQSSVQETLTRKQICSHPNYGKLTNSIGTSEEVFLSVKTDHVKRGDVFLLCSDGLYKYCSEKYLKKVLRSVSEENVEAGVRELVDKTHKQGAGDNVSVILVKCFARKT